MNRLPSALIAIVVSGVAATAQAPRDRPSAATGAASLAGTIVAGDAAHHPIRRALVTLSGGGLAVDRMAISADDGGFAFTGLPAGRYLITASKPGQVTTFYGSPRPGRGPGTPVALGDGAVTNVSIVMLPGAVIGGTIRNAYGQPLPRAGVSLLEIRRVDGEDTLVPVKTMTAEQDGTYRFYGLAPATYVVAARNTSPGDFNGASVQIASAIDAALRDLAAGRPPQMLAASPAAAVVLGRPSGYAPTLAPRAVDPSTATRITLAAGEERTAIDVSLQLVATANLRGTVVDPTGQPPLALQLSLISATQTLGWTGGIVSSSSVTVRNGTFTRDSLTPGSYEYFARAADRGDTSMAAAPAAGRAAQPPLTLWARGEIAIAGRDVTDLTIKLEPGMTIAGRIVFDASRGPAPRDLTRVQVRLTPVATHGLNLTVAPAAVDADGAFAVRGVPPGRYLISTTAIAGWSLESAKSGGADTLDDGLTIEPGHDVADMVATFTDRPAVMSGRLIDAGGHPAPDYAVIVFSADPRFRTSTSRRMHLVRPASDGRFEIAGLPPGDYLVGAVTDLTAIDVNDTAFLDALAAAAVKVTLTKDHTEMLDLRVGG